MVQSNMQLDHIARIEGHGNIHVLIEDNAVKTVEFQVTEPARFFESMVVGRKYSEVPFIASRVCGICSANHAITSLKAIEKIFEVEVSERTNALRELLVYGSYLQNHTTHLYVLAAADYVGTESIFPLAQSNPSLFESALRLKALGNELCNQVGGRSIHPITAVTGGFTHEIASDGYRELAEKLDEMIPFALETVDLFNSFPIPEISIQGELLAMVEEGSYPIVSSDQIAFLKQDKVAAVLDIFDYIEEIPCDHSNALFAYIKSSRSPYMTSALARVNASWNNLCSEARVAAAKVALRPPVDNPFRNNVAQAIELVDALVRCRDMCLKLSEDQEMEESKPPPFSPRSGHAIACTEAPRGLLFHELDLDDQGRVRKASILTPTAQNIANMEADIRALAETLLAKGTDEKTIILEIKKLVRAYDPCLSCSVH